MGDERSLDPAVLASLRALTPPGEPDVLAEILATFLDDVPRRLETLARAVEGGVVADAARVAHSVKGSAGNIGARRLQQLAGAAEESARRGEVGALRGHAEAIVAEFARVAEEIRRVT